MFKLLFLALGILASTAAVASADEPVYFSKGTWIFDTYGAYAKNFTGEEAKIGSGTIGVGYYIVDNFAVNIEASGYYNHQQVQDARISAGDIMIRHHVFNSGRFSFYLEGVAGISYADHRTPYFGTYYNYILEPGIGASFRLFDDVNLIGGVRYFHLSNAHLEGPLHNPSINATQAYVGLMYKF
jgi:hypothetical protein